MENTLQNNRKTLIIYNYFEMDKLRKDNLLFLLNYTKDPDITLYIVYRNKTFSIDLNPFYKNFETINTIYFENIGYDFNGYKFGLNNNDLSIYNYVFLMNDSTCGPFSTTNVLDKFISMCTENVSSIGTYHNLHTKLPKFQKLINNYFPYLPKIKYKGFFSSNLIFLPQKTVNMVKDLFNLVNFNTFKDCLTMEKYTGSYLMTKGNVVYTFKKQTSLYDKFDLFEGIFIKSNRIGKNNTFSDKDRKKHGKRICKVSCTKFNECKTIMQNLT